MQKPTGSRETTKLKGFARHLMYYIHSGKIL